MTFDEDNTDRFREMIAMMPETVYETDLEGRLLFVNEAAFAKWGYQPEDLARGLTIFDMVVEADRPRALENVRRFADCASPGHDYTGRRKDGSTFPITVYSAPIIKKGSFTGLRGFVIDRTEQSRIHLALQASEEKYCVAIEATSDGIWESDLSAGRISLSPVCRALLGTNAETLDFQSWSQLLHHDERREVLEKLRECLAGREEGWRCEHRLRMADGSWKWRLVRGKVVERDAGGAPQRMVGTVADIDDRKHADAELRSQRDQLRSLAAQLSLAEDRERRRIAAALHDDVAQQLALCKIKVQMLQRARPRSGELRELCELLSEAIQGVRSSLFDLSPPVLHELGFVAALSWLREQMETRHSLRCDVVTHEDVQELPDDLKAFLFQAARELLINVRKHAQASRAQVQVESNAAEFVVRVKDDGCGFERAETSCKEGCFGLFNIRERLRHFGGDLRIISAFGKGSTVEMRLPAECLAKRLMKSAQQRQ